MSSLAVLNCMRSKQIYPCGPREMYWPSILFRSQVAFVEARYDNWVVVSSKYGVVQQDQIIEPYDAFVGSSGLVIKETTKKYTTAEKRAWGKRVSQEIVALGYDQVDYFISNSYASLFPNNTQGRFLKANSGGTGLFRAIQKWKEMAADNKSIEELLLSGDLLPIGTKEIYVKSDWEEVMRAPRWWYHQEFGEFYGNVYEVHKHAKQFDPLVDQATFGQILKGKVSQHKGWRTYRKEAGKYLEEVTLVVDWIHPEYGQFTGSARDLRDLYGHDESNLKNVAIGKTKSSYGWRLHEE